jgi:hypothetical protein
MTKCCTKRPNCDKQPKCSRKANSSVLFTYFILFNILLIILRLLLLKREEIAAIRPGWFNHMWWYFMFILFLELQLFGIYCLYYITIQTIKSIKVCLLKLKYYLTEILGIRITNPFMKWLTLINTDWWLYKIWCIISFFFYIFCLFVIVFGYLGVVLLFGPYLLGYYKIDAPSW